MPPITSRHLYFQVKVNCFEALVSISLAKRRGLCRVVFVERVVKLVKHCSYALFVSKFSNGCVASLRNMRPAGPTSFPICDQQSSLLYLSRGSDRGQLRIRIFASRMSRQTAISGIGGHS